MTTQPLVEPTFRRRRAFACRVEQLEERFLLARPPLSVPAEGVVDVATPRNAAATEAEDDSAGWLDPGEEGPTDPTGPVAAKELAPEADVAVIGTMSPSGSPTIFRLPVNPADRSIVIEFFWLDRAGRTPANLVLLNESADVVWSHRLPNKAFAVDLEFASPGAGSGTALYLEILPAAHGPSPGSAPPSGYRLEVQRFAGPMGWTHDPAMGWASDMQVLGFGPSSSPSTVGSPPPPVTTRPPSPDTGASVALPLPAVPSSPVGGIFSLGDAGAPAAPAATTSVDPNSLDLAPVRIVPARDHVRQAFAAATRSADGEAVDPFCVGPRPDDPGRPAPVPALGAWAVDQVLNAEAGGGLGTSGRPLPPAGVRVLERLLDEPAAAARPADRPMLPRLVDGGPCGSCGGLAVADPGRGACSAAAKRSGSVLAVVYGSACWLLGVTAPNLSATLGRAVREAVAAERPKRSRQTDAAV